MKIQKLIIFMWIMVFSLFSVDFEVIKNMNYARIQTSKGSVVIEFYSQETPENILFFKGIATGYYYWIDKNGNTKKDTPFYNGTKVEKIYKDRYFLIGGVGGQFYQWIGYDIQDEIDKRGKEIKGTIKNDTEAGIVWGNYILSAYDKDRFENNLKLKKLYNEIMRKKSYKPLYGKSVLSIREMSGFDKKIYNKIRIRQPKENDVFLYNIGKDTAYGVLGIYTKTVTEKRDLNYTVIGRVIEGQDVVSSINEVETRRRRPIDSIIINKIEITAQ